jgi:hypothetical protein
MGQVITTQQINSAQLADALGGGVALTFYGAREDSTAEKTVEAVGKTDQEISTALASITYDPYYSADLTEIEWRDIIEADLAWLQNEVDTAPGPGTTTSGNAVTRLDAVIQHVKKLDRGLIRVFEFILNNVKDTDE